MKIFPKESPMAKPTKNTEKSSGKEAKTLARKKSELPAKKNMSAADIREKLAAHVDTSDVAKNMAIKNTKKLGDGFMNDSVKPELVKVEVPELEVKSPNTEDFTLNSDIAKNNPKDTNTQEKLKTVLSKGAFNFNPKERDALEKILANQ